MNKKQIVVKILIVIALMLLPSALADNAVQFNTDSRVYIWPSLDSYYVEVSEGLEVSQKDDATSGWTRVELNGSVGYTNAEHLSKVNENAQGDLIVIQKSAIVTETARVYAAPRTSSASIRIPKGMQLTLVATNGDWAMVANGGYYAYMNKSQIEVCEAFSYSEKLDSYAATITQDTNVYALPNASAYSLSVSKGMRVGLLKIQDGWALVENAGIRAYVKADCVALVTADVDPTPAPTATPAPTSTPDYSGLMKNAIAAEMTADAYVYAQPDDSAEKLQIEKGTRVNFLMSNGNWALIEKDGNYGYISGMLLKKVEAETTPAPTKNTDTLSEIMESDKYTNEQKCYYYLTQKMGLNTAAACGVLSNIRAECSFNPNDQTGKYYGLCQWGDGRLSNMKKYCSDNGYDYTTVEGQMRFLEYELENSYPKVLKMLQETSNSPEGAYEAGYNFCYDYERPANRTGSSVKRGNMAKDTYYPKYNG